MKLTKPFLFIALISLSFCSMFGQAIVQTGGYTATQLANYLAGPNITISNAVFTGASVAGGQFTAAGTTFPMASGVILSTGNISTAPGPNGSAGGGAGALYNLGTVGTTQMTTLGGATSYDAVTLEFDFDLQSSSIEFNYIFASEEYPEFAPPNSSSYNDVFAFYISGPGIVGQQNIALVPTTALPVSINNINAITNTPYYVNNTGGPAVQFDGYTTLLTAQKLGLTACQTYHLKFVIADIGDHIYNSAVFLQENSFVQGDIISGATQTINADGIALEGCVKGQFNFNLASPATQDVIINYTTGGTAVNGVDYAFLDNSITIPAGSSSGTIYVDAFSDGLTEGAETVTLTYTPSLCAVPVTITLTINDAQPISFTLDGTNLDCFGNNSGEILVNATGGFPAYTYYVTAPTGSISTTQTNPITGLPAGQYSVQVHDTYGCKAEALVIGGQFNAGSTFLPDGSGVTYSAPLAITGFNPGQMITNVNQIQQICVTMEHSYLGDLWIRVQSPSGQIVTLKEQNGGASCDLGEPIATGPVDGTGSSDITPGIGYEYCFNASPVYSTMVNESGNFSRNYTDGVGNTYTDTYLPAGSYTPTDNFSSLVGSPMNGTWTVLVTDQFGLDNGYIFNWYISLVGDLPDTLVTLTEPAQITVSGVATNATCGTANGSINISALNGVAPVTYSWSNGATTEDITSVLAGSYTVTVSDGNGCSTAQTFIVNNIGTLAISSTSTPISCFGGNNGAISIVASGGSTPYTYSWSNGAVTQNIVNVAAGNYTVTMTDQIGCVFSQAITVIQNNQITPTLVALSDEICNTTNGSIDVSVAGGNGSYGYAWSNGATTQDLSNLNSGTYTLTITDGLGCTGLAPYVVANNLTGCSNFCYLDVTQNTLTNATCGGANGAINVNILNAVAPYTITWSNGATTEDLTGLLPGTYTITVLDVNNCSQTSSFTIGNTTTGLAIASSSISDEMCGNANGGISITITGGTGPFNYLWSNGSGAQNVQNLSQGTYSVQVTDGVGCIIAQTYSVLNNSGALSATAIVSSSMCTSNNGAITQTIIGANGATTYLWSTGATSLNINSLAPGNYSCTVTDASSCSFTNTYTVTQNTSGIALTGTLITNEICNNTLGAINITVSGSSLTYLWSNGATTQDITGLNSGNYSCIISNSTGCTLNTGSITVINTSGNLVVSNQAITNELCNNNAGAININVFGGTPAYTYLWSNGATTQDLTALNEGLYTVQVSDNNGCSQAHSVTITNAAGSLSISSSVLTHENCSGGIASNGQGAINITVIGATTPYTYVWSNGPTTQDVTNLTDGNYSVTVNAANGCSLTQGYTILPNGSNIAITSSSISDESCGSATGSVGITMSSDSGPYNYSWSNGASIEDISALSAGTYTIMVSNLAGCQITQAFVVGNDPGTLAATNVLTNETCGNNNGAINIGVTGGNLPYSYVWSNGATTQDLSTLSAGTYTLAITDLYGCSSNYSGVVANITTGLALAVTTVTNESCGNDNGAINVTVTGTPTTFAWSNGALTEDISALSQGTYTLTVTDNTSCSVTTSATVLNQTGTLAISFTNTQNETCGNGQGFIDISTSGTGPFTYLWSTGATTQDIVGLSSATYTVAITDGVGCVLNQSFSIGNSNISNVSATANVTNSTCTTLDGAIDITVTSGIVPFTYSWNTGATSQDISGLGAGNFTVVITDGANCQTTQSVSIASQFSDLSIINIDIFDDFCNSSQGGLNINTTGTPIEFFVNGTDYGTPFVSPLTAGTYAIVLTDIYGCSINSNAVIGNTSSFTTTGAVTNATCGSTNGAIVLTMFSTSGTESYSWSNGATTTNISNLAPGSYTVTVSDPAGPFGPCVDQMTFVVGNDVDFVITGTSIDDYCGQGSGSINQTVVSGSGLVYLWSNGATIEDVSGLDYGTYTCNVTFPGGCSQDFTYVVGNLTNGTFVNAIVTNEICSNGLGSINLTLSGGSGNNTFVWSNAATTEDITGLTAGSYDVTIIDVSDGCIFAANYIVSNTLTNFSATGTVLNATCATCLNGTANVTIANSASYSFLWSNGATTEDISGLNPGNYSVVITSAAGCDTTLLFSLGNSAELDDISASQFSMSVYPNPATTSFTVDLVLPFNLAGELTVTDVVGKIVAIQPVTENGVTIFSTNAMNDGVYFVILKAGNITKMQRVVISNN